jgi:predicted nucleic acid-binding protein
MSYAAVVDTCVLFPNTLRDTVLTLAQDGLFRPLWSSAILDELKRTVLARGHTDATAFARTLALMSSAFEDAEVTGWESLVSGLELPDNDDRHVLAAALAGGAQSIVTFNLKDFPGDCLRPHFVDAIHPDEFLLDQLDLAPRLVISALARQAARYRRPPMDLHGLLRALDRSGVTGFTEEVRRLVL